MSDAAPATESPVASPRFPRLRFSLGGMFVFTLGVALALAYRRMRDIAWSDMLLAAVTTWITAGLIQHCGHIWLRWREHGGLAREIQWGFSLDVARPLAAIMMLASAAALNVTQRLEVRPPFPDQYAWALEGLTFNAFFLRRHLCILAPTTTEPDAFAP